MKVKVKLMREVTDKGLFRNVCLSDLFVGIIGLFIRMIEERQNKLIW